MTGTFRANRTDNGELVEGYYGVFLVGTKDHPEESHQIYTQGGGMRWGLDAPDNGVWHHIDPSTLEYLGGDGCEYCTDLSKYKGFGYAELFHQTAADECYEIGIDVKFCPNCGKLLNEKGD